MPYLILKGTAIEDIVIDDPGAGVFLDLSLDEEGAPVDPIAAAWMVEINANKFGHAVFDYVAGVVVLNQAREDAFILEDEKMKLIETLIQNEIVNMAKERLALPIQAIKNAADQAALNALRSN